MAAEFGNTQVSVDTVHATAGVPTGIDIAVDLISRRIAGPNDFLNTVSGKDLSTTLQGVDCGREILGLVGKIAKITDAATWTIQAVPDKPWYSTKEAPWESLASAQRSLHLFPHSITRPAERFLRGLLIIERQSVQRQELTTHMSSFGERFAKYLRARPHGGPIQVSDLVRGVLTNFE